MDEITKYKFIQAALAREIFYLDKNGFFDIIKSRLKVYSNYSYYIDYKYTAEILTLQLSSDIGDSDKIEDVVKQERICEITTEGLQFSQFIQDCIKCVKSEIKKLFDSINKDNIVEILNSFNTGITAFLDEFFLKNSISEEIEEKPEGTLPQLSSFESLIIERDYYTHDFEYMLRNELIDNRTDKQVELDVSSFYLINELIADNYTAGPWKDLRDWAFDVHISGFEEDENWIASFLHSYEIIRIDKLLSLLDHKNAFSISSESIVNKRNYVESIFQIDGFYVSSLINKSLRGIHDGFYCPLNVSEVLKLQALSIPVQQQLNEAVSSIESQDPILRSFLVQKYINIFKEKGYVQSEEILKELYPTFEKHDQETKNQGRKLDILEPHISKQIESIMNLLSKNKVQKPSYYDELGEDNKKRVDNILDSLALLPFPLLSEEPEKYESIITDMARFVEDVLCDAWGYHDKGNALTINKLHGEAGKHFFPVNIHDNIKCEIEKYAEDYGPYHNKSGKHVNGNPRPTYKKTISFIFESNRILQLILESN